MGGRRAIDCVCLKAFHNHSILLPDFTLLIRLTASASLKQMGQECIPVGCVPPAHYRTVQRTPLDRDPPSQTSPPLIETPPVDKQTSVKTLPSQTINHQVGWLRIMHKDTYWGKNCENVQSPVVVFLKMFRALSSVCIKRQ